MNNGLQALKKIKGILGEEYELCDVIEKEFKEYEKLKKDIKKCSCWNEHKALEIIKKKKVDVKYLCYRAEFNVEKYNDNYIETLTQKECDLLKEVFKK